MISILLITQAAQFYNKKDLIEVSIYLFLKLAPGIRRYLPPAPPMA
jgi:hypothetical protein